MSSKTQRLALDLERNEELAELVADLEPGEKVDAVLSIIAKDAQTLTVEVEEVSNHTGGDEDEEDEDEMPHEESTPAMKMMGATKKNE